MQWTLCGLCNSPVGKYLFLRSRLDGDHGCVSASHDPSGIKQHKNTVRIIKWKLDDCLLIKESGEKFLVGNVHPLLQTRLRCFITSKLSQYNTSAEMTQWWKVS